MERLVDPILTDIHVEAAAAGLKGRWWTRLWIQGRGMVALVNALTLHAWTGLWRFQEWPADDRRVLARTLTRIAANYANAQDMSLAAHYHLRWALAAAPVVLTSWAFLVVTRLPNRRWVVGLVAIASCVAYYTLMSTGHGAVLRRALPPIAGAWLPNAAFVAAIALLTRRTPNDERRTASVSR